MKFGRASGLDGGSLGGCDHVHDIMFLLGELGQLVRLITYVCLEQTFQPH